MVLSGQYQIQHIGCLATAVLGHSERVEAQARGLHACFDVALQECAGVPLPGEFEAAVLLVLAGCRHAAAGKSQKPCLTLQPPHEAFPFEWRRPQFPVQTAFALTINKAQGQMLRRVAISDG